MVSSIGPAGSPQSAPVDGASQGQAPLGTGSGNLQSDPSNPALYLSFGSGAFPTSALGIRSPINPESADLILAEAALALEQTRGAARQSSIEARYGGYRGAVSTALADVRTKEAAAAEAKGALATATLAEAGAQTTLSGFEAEKADLEARKQALASADPRPSDYDTQMGVIEGLLQDVALDIQGATEALDEAKQVTEAAKAASAKADAALAYATVGSLQIFAQVAVTQRSDDGADRSVEAAHGTQVEQGFDDIGARREQMRDAEVERADETALRTDEERERQTLEKLEALAAGLAAGVSDLAALLRAPGGEPAVNVRDEAALSGRRFQLAL